MLLPIFVIPARRMGSRLAQLEREAAGHNAAMTTQMTERFSAPGATLVKLFGDPRREEAEFGQRAERVAEIGVRSAMGQFVFLTALALVSALALALIYGLGGYLAVHGRLDAGTVVTMALLLGQLYAPLTALASARVDAMTALVSFERVFEVLDLEPLIDEAPDATTVPPGPVGVAFDDVSFAYPTADKVSLASLEEVATLDTRGGDEVLHDVSFAIEPGEIVALVGSSGAGKSTIASLLPRLYDVDAGSVSIGGVDVRRLTFDSLRRTDRHGHPGRPPVPREHRREPAVRRPRGVRGRAVGGVARAPASTRSCGRCRPASTPSSGSGATGCRVASASA